MSYGRPKSLTFIAGLFDVHWSFEFSVNLTLILGQCCKGGSDISNLVEDLILVN